ncbi:MAG: hypothetical protein HOP04_08730 [Methylophilaceae bacterium]|nr:hypothetical protein [Methylophilaceae bacterium]
MKYLLRFVVFVLMVGHFSAWAGLNEDLLAAARNGNSEEVKRLLDAHADVSVQDAEGVTPLHEAAASGNRNTVELLIAQHANVNASDRRGFTPLHLAAKNDHTKVVETLLTNKANIAQQTIEGESPLSIAAVNGNSATTELLLIHGANANIKDKQGQPLLFKILSIERRFYSLVSPYFSNELSSDDREKLAKLRQEVKGEWQVVSKLLVKHGADVSEDQGGNGPLYMAATIGDRELVELMLAKGARVDGDVSKCVCETPLHSAIAERHTEIAELLINRGANVNALNRSNRTPLHFLARDVKDKKLAELMISQGADVNAKDKYGETAYDFAIRTGNQVVASVLQQHGGKANQPTAKSKLDALNRMLDNGVSPNQKLPDGSTLLTSMVTAGDLILVEHLLERGADVNAKGENDIPPLIAVFTTPLLQTPLGLILAKQTHAPKEFIDIVRTMQGQWREISLLLIKKGADINTHAPNNGMTPLHYAASLGYRDVAEVLLVKGANIDAKDAQNATPLYFAIMADHSDMVSMLLEKEANNNAVGIEGVTLLHLAVASRQDESGKLLGSQKIAKLLISRGANINAKTKSGNSPLHLVARYTGEVEVAKLLIDKGAEVNALDNDSHTPLYYATEQGNTDVAEILIQHGATK